MPRPRFQKLPEEKQTQILEIAAQTFATDGYSGASINRILQEAGLSKGAFYYYFDDKADLYQTIIQRMFDVVQARASFDIESLSANTFWPQVEALFLQQFHEDVDAPWWTFELMRQQRKCLPDESNRDPIAPILARHQQWMNALFRRGQQLGVVRTDLPFELLIGLIAQLDDAFDRYIVNHKRELSRQQLSHLAIQMIGLLKEMARPTVNPEQEGT